MLVKRVRGIMCVMLWLAPLILLGAAMLACSSSDDATATNARDAGKSEAGGKDAEKSDGEQKDVAVDAKGCLRATCASSNANCGQIPDGCGGVLDCGACTAGESCGGGGPNRCGNKPCEPTTCAAMGKNCGDITDGCSKTLACGTCAAPDTCGGGTESNRCGCTPSGCESLGVECGDVFDGCSHTLACGKCAAPDSCGGAGIPNHCGCTPNGCGNKGCGEWDNGCGGTMNCGNCAAGELCHIDRCCVSSVDTDCTKSCYELQGPARGYSQFEDVWCSGVGQTKATVTNCSAPDPDPCTTAALPVGCGLVAGMVWCDVTCHHNFDCPGITQCNGTCG